MIHTVPDIGMTIKYIRESQERGRKKFAAECGVAEYTVARLENNLGGIGLDNFLRIIDGLGLTMSQVDQMVPLVKKKMDKLR